MFLIIIQILLAYLIGSIPSAALSFAKEFGVRFPQLIKIPRECRSRPITLKPGDQRPVNPGPFPSWVLSCHQNHERRSRHEIDKEGERYRTQQLHERPARKSEEVIHRGRTAERPASAAGASHR